MTPEEAKAASLTLFNCICAVQHSRPPLPEPLPGTRYAEPLYYPPPTQAECEEICSKCPDLAASLGLSDRTYSGCIELAGLKLKNKKRAEGSDANQALVWSRKIRTSSGRSGQGTTAKLVVADMARWLHHYLVAPGQAGGQFERCQLSTRCCNPNHFVAVRCHGGTPHKRGRARPAVSASSASAATPKPAARSAPRASPDLDARVAAPPSGTADAAFVELLECGEVLPSGTTTRSGRSAGGAWNVPRFEAGPATRPSSSLSEKLLQRLDKKVTKVASAVASLGAESEEEDVDTGFTVMRHGRVLKPSERELEAPSFSGTRRSGDRLRGRGRSKRRRVAPLSPKSRREAQRQAAEGRVMPEVSRARGSAFVHV